MVLQVSGAISLDDIQAEFGGTNPTAISEYYRGGLNVPDTPANAGIPTSGSISFTDFYGGDATVDTDAPTFAAFKTTTTSRSNTTVLADPNLQFVSLPAGKYIMEGFLNTTSASTSSPGHMQMTFTAGTLVGSFFMMTGAGTEGSNSTLDDFRSSMGSTIALTYTNIDTVNVDDVATGVGYTIRGSFETSTTATWSLNWAQSTASGGNATSMRDGSWIKLWEVA